MGVAAKRSSFFSQLQMSSPPVAGDGDGEASEASEWEDREHEEQLTFLREEDEGLGRGVRRISGSLGCSLFSLVFHLSFFCPTSFGGQRAGGFILMALGQPTLFVCLFLHLLHATYIDHGNIHT